MIYETGSTSEFYGNSCFAVLCCSEKMPLNNMLLGKTHLENMQFNNMLLKIMQQHRMVDNILFTIFDNLLVANLLVIGVENI